MQGYMICNSCHFVGCILIAKENIRYFSRIGGLGRAFEDAFDLDIGAWLSWASLQGLCIRKSEVSAVIFESGLHGEVVNH